MKTIAIIAFLALTGLAFAETPAEQIARRDAEITSEFETEQFARRKVGTLNSEDIKAWSPEAKARWTKENPGFKDWDGLAYNSVNPNLPKAEQQVLQDQNSGKVAGLSGPQLADYSSKHDAGGMFWYIGLVWCVFPLTIFFMLSSSSTRAFGVILLIPYLIFIFPRWIEMFALFIVLPAIIVIGFIKMVFKGL